MRATQQIAARIQSTPGNELDWIKYCNPALWRTQEDESPAFSERHSNYFWRDKSPRFCRIETGQPLSMIKSNR
jgi:hypothetical protein